MKDRLFISADDLTGTLDTCIQFVNMGLAASAATDPGFSAEEAAGCRVLAVNTDSRHLEPAEAYRAVYETSEKARAAGFSYAYKKTDSALRGNIGAELEAMMDAYEEDVIAFVPAFPAMGRVTRGGVHFIGDTPVSESVFGSDPIDPVRFSRVAEIVGAGSGISCMEIGKDELTRLADSIGLRKNGENGSGPEGPCPEPAPGKKTVFIFDAETDEDLYIIADVLKSLGMTSLMAGCAGFAAAYEKLLDKEAGCPENGQAAEAGSKKGAAPKASGGENACPGTCGRQACEGLITVCGSLNPITLHQLDFAGEHGFARLHLPFAALTDREAYSAFLEEACAAAEASAGRCIVDALFPEWDATDDLQGSGAQKDPKPVATLLDAGLPGLIADTLGRLALDLSARFPTYALSLTGGDTLMGFMRQSGAHSLRPLKELEKGVVLSEAAAGGRTVLIVSKSGGFGAEDSFVRVSEKLLGGVPG